MFGPNARARPLAAILFAASLWVVPCFADESEPLALQGNGFTLFAGYMFGGSFNDNAPEELDSGMGGGGAKRVASGGGSSGGASELDDEIPF